MAAISTKDFIRYPVSMEPPQEEGGSVDFGPLTLGAMDLISEVSSSTQTVYSTIDQFSGLNDPISLSILGGTSFFSVFNGVIGFQEGWREASLAKRVGDVWGRFLSMLKCLRGSVQTLAGIIFVPVRALAVAAALTASKVYEVVADSWGQIGGGLFGFVNVITAVANTVEVYRGYCFREKVYKLLEIEGGSDYLNVLENNWEKLQASLISLALSVMGIAATVLGLVCTGGPGLVMAVALSLFVGLGWLVINIAQLKEAFDKEEVGRFDRLVLAVVTYFCIIVTALATIFSGGIIPLVVTGGVGLVWLGINVICLLRLQRKIPNDAETLPKACCG